MKIAAIGIVIFWISFMLIPSIFFQTSNNNTKNKLVLFFFTFVALIGIVLVIVGTKNKKLQKMYRIQIILAMFFILFFSDAIIFIYIKIVPKYVGIGEFREMQNYIKQMVQIQKMQPDSTFKNLKLDINTFVKVKLNTFVTDQLKQNQLRDSDNQKFEFEYPQILLENKSLKVSMERIIISNVKGFDKFEIQKFIFNPKLIRIGTQKKFSLEIHGAFSIIFPKLQFLLKLFTEINYFTYKMSLSPEAQISFDNAAVYLKYSFILNIDEKNNIEYVRDDIYVHNFRLLYSSSKTKIVKIGTKKGTDFLSKLLQSTFKNAIASVNYNMEKYIELQINEYYIPEFFQISEKDVTKKNAEKAELKKISWQKVLDKKNTKNEDIANVGREVLKDLVPKDDNDSIEMLDNIGNEQLTKMLMEVALEQEKQKI